jgi:hypothetical protein
VQHIKRIIQITRGRLIKEYEEKIIINQEKVRTGNLSGEKSTARVSILRQSEELGRRMRKAGRMPSLLKKPLEV